MQITGWDGDAGFLIDVINLWDKPEPERKKVKARVKHGTVVSIIDKRVYNEQLFYKVRSFLKRGWVSEGFVEECTLQGRSNVKI